MKLRIPSSRRWPRAGRRATGRGSSSRAARRCGSRARARRPRAGRRRRRSSRCSRLGMIPSRVLDDADVVDEREQVVGAQARQMQVGDAGGPSAAARTPRPREDRRGRLGDRRPGEHGADPPRLRPCRVERVGLLDVVADRGRRPRPGRRTARGVPGARGEHVLRVPVGGRDDAAAGCDREGERAGGDLLPVAVRRHEHVGRGEQVGELVDREEAVVELDVVAEAELDARAAPASAGSARPRGAPRRDACGRRSRRPSPDAARRSRAAPRSPSRGPCRRRSARRWRAGTDRPCRRTRRYGARLGAVRRAARPVSRAARRAARRAPSPRGTRPRRRAAAAPSPSSRSRARPRAQSSVRTSA